MGLRDLEQCLWYEPVLVGIRGNEQVETEVPPHTVQASMRIPSRAGAPIFHQELPILQGLSVQVFGLFV